MLKTITVGSCVSIQGLYVKTLPDGRVAVRVGDTIYTGYPVAKAA
ncbi:hypothetical protein [Aestuariivita boseongensis]|nr:hypothetical protein [Aestuariivita boseongensis]